MRPIKRGLCLWALCLGAIACASGQSRADYYQTRNSIECQDEPSCVRLLAEIDRELLHTPKADSGPLLLVRERVNRRVEGYGKPREDEAERDRYRTRVAMAEAAEDAKAQEAAKRRAELEEHAAQRAAEEAKIREAERKDRVDVWRGHQVRGCKAHGEEGQCRPTADTREEEVDACRIECVAAISNEVAATQREALRWCVARYTDDVVAGRKPSTTCSPERGARFPERINATECAADCKREGDQHVIAWRESHPKPAKGGGGGGEFLQCCDGTRSPSCRVDRASYRGCCSHHGGVC